MKKLIALLTCIALFAIQLIIAVPFGVTAAEGDATPVYSFDYTDSTNTELWADGGVDQSTTGLKRSVQFSDENSMANATGSRDNTVKSYITYDSGGLRFRSKSRIDNGFHFAQCAITLEVGATYELVTNARVSGNTFDIMITDQMRAGTVTIDDNVSVYATNNYVTSSNFAEKSVVFTATESNVYLTLALQAVDGIMARVKSIVINKIETAAESDATVNENFENYYHTFDFSDEALYLDFANDSGKTNITGNGEVTRYTDGSRTGLRIKSGGSLVAYTSACDIKLKPNTEYVMVAHARVMADGDILNINIKQKFNDAIIEGSAIAINGTSAGYYVSRFTTNDFENSAIELSYVPSVTYKSGVLYDLTIYPLETSPVNGTFETGNLNGWMQISDTLAITSTSAKRGSCSMKMVNGSNVSTYFLAKQGKNIAYMCIKTNSTDNITQTVNIYKMEHAVKNTFDSNSLVGTMSAQSSNAGYTLFKFGFEVEEDTIVALNLNSTQKDYWIDQIYVLPETYASFATFNTDKDGYNDTFLNSIDKNPAKIADNALYLDGRTSSSEVETVLNLRAGETYTLSYYVKVEQGGAYGSEDAKPEVMLVDLGKSDSSNQYKSVHYAVQLNDGWEYKNVKITPTEDSVYRLVLRCNEGSSAFFDDVALFKVGDINGDSLTNAVDIVSTIRFLIELDEEKLPNQVYDINEDGNSNVIDLVALKKKLIILNINAYEETLKANGDFIYGVNLPWFGKSDNKYQIFGTSPFTQEAATYSHDYADAALTDISSIGFTSVRTWVFSGWGGTTMDEDGNITGLTPEFIANLTDYLSLIREKGLTANLVLVPHIVQDVPSVEDQTTAMKTVLDETARDSYINNALIPTLRALKDYQDCIVAIDLYCEPEGDAEDTAGIDDTNYPGRTALLSDITPFINAQAAAVKSVLPNVKCLVSSAYSQNYQGYVTYADCDIDILGFNIYDDDSNVVIPENRIDSTVAAKFADRWITECNYYSKDVTDWTEEKFSDIVRNFYINAKTSGYSACYMWHYAASYETKTSLVEGTQNNPNEPDLSKLRLSAQLLHYDIMDYNNSIGKTAGNDVPALLVNGDNTSLRWLGSRQAAYYQIEYKNNSGWQLLETVQHISNTNLYEYTLDTEFAIGTYPVRVVSYAADGNRRISNVIE